MLDAVVSVDDIRTTLIGRRDPAAIPVRTTPADPKADGTTFILPAVPT
jgi:hypothetical protein